jgi:hypothetical protein
MVHDDGPDDLIDLASISEARRLAAIAVMLLENPNLAAGEGQSGLYVTALSHAKVILYLVRETEACSDAEEFDVLLYLIHCNVDGLARTLSLLRIP